MMSPHLVLLLLLTTSHSLMELQLLPKGTKGGQCIDGSPAGFYYESGLSNTWVINLQGGGHCSTNSSCQQRANTTLGSSNNWTKSKVGQGSLSTSPINNPDFYDAHHIELNYCSGDWHTGTRTNATTETWNLYFSGHLIIKNIIQYLINMNPSILSADYIMINGESAGAVGVFLNLDFIANEINSRNSSIKIKGIPIAGWQFAGNTTDQINNPMMPPNDYSHWKNNSIGGEGHDSYEPDLWNSYLPDSCVNALNKSGKDTWHCISVHNLYPYINTPMFVLQNKFDSNVITTNFNMPTSIVNNDTKGYVTYFGTDMDRSILNQIVFAKNNTNGLFYASCYDHVSGLEINNNKSTTIINGFNTTQLIGDWFYERNELPHIVYDMCQPSQLPCNPTCTPYGAFKL